MLDGEIVAWKGGRVLPFSLLQQRIGRKSLSKKILESAPVQFIAFDILEHAGADVRSQILAERRDARSLSRRGARHHDQPGRNDQ